MADRFSAVSEGSQTGDIALPIQVRERERESGDEARKGSEGKVDYDNENTSEFKAIGSKRCERLYERE
jgi:hypothetical protein